MASKIKLTNANGNTTTISNNNGSTADIEVSYFNTVDELTNASGSEGFVAVVSELDIGGTFVYKSANTGINNGDTIFNGWTRQAEYGKAFKSTTTACSLFAGLNETEIFTGASNASQGLAYLDGKVYLKQKVAGTSNYNNELSRIVEYTYSDTEGYVYNNSYTGEIYTGHQGLGVYNNGTNVIAISGYRTEVADDGTNDYGKGYTSTDLTTEVITQYQLFGHSTSNHKYKEYYGATPTCTKDGKYIIISAVKSGVSSTNFIFTYDRAEVESASNSLDVEPISIFKVLKPAVESSPLQDVTANSKYIYLYYGYYGSINNHVVRVYDYNGVLVNEFSERHLFDNLGFNDGTYTYQSFEPEGVALNDNGELLLLCMKNKIEGEDIVSFDGNNYACIADHTGKSPLLQDYWTLTDFSATSGVWDENTAYDNGSYVSKDKIIIKVGYDSDGTIINTSTNTNNASLPLTSSTVDMAYEFGDSFQLKSYNEQTNTYFNAYEITRSSLGTKYKFYDNKELSNNDSPFTLDVINNATSQVSYIRQNELQANGAGINMYGGGDTTSPNELHLMSGGSLGGTGLKVLADKVVDIPVGMTFNGGTLFNDYKEDSWIPVFADAITGGNSFTFTTIYSKYIKVGNMVTLFCSISGLDTSSATAGNNIYIRNLPFVPDTSFASPIGPCKVTKMTSDSPATNTSVVVRVSGSNLVLASYDLDGGDSPYVDADWFATGAAIEFSLSYKSA